MNTRLVRVTYGLPTVKKGRQQNGGTISETFDLLSPSDKQTIRELEAMGYPIYSIIPAADREPAREVIQ